jgi:hypothetical protein
MCSCARVLCVYICVCAGIRERVCLFLWSRRKGYTARVEVQ